MTYKVRPLIPEYKDPQEIDEAEYKEITRDRKLAWDILLVKEFFSYIIRNFCELENKIKKREEIEKEKFRSDFFTRDFIRDNNHILNLLIMNLLTTCRSYLDLFDYQGMNKKRDIFIQKKDLRQVLENIKNKYHDRDKLYSFFWYLRNYAQHHSRPIKGSPTKIDSVSIEIGFTVDFKKVFESTKLNKLYTLEDFKKYLMQDLHYSQQDLQKYPNQLNIRPIIKKYVLLINEINEEFNYLLNSEFQEVKNRLKHKIIYYCNDNSPESGFEVFKEDAKTQELEECFDVCLQVINDWEKTVEKYSSL